MQHQDDLELDYLDQKSIKRPKKTKKQQEIDAQNQELPSDLSQDGDCQCYYCGEMVAYKVIQNHMKSSHGRFHRKM